MTFVHSKSSRVLIGSSHLSGSLTGWSVGHKRALGAGTTLLSEGTQWVPGVLSGTLTLSGLFNAATSDIHATVRDASGVDNGLLVTVAPNGLTDGSVALMSVSDIESYAISASVSETVSIQVTAPPDDGVDMGVLVHALAARAADGQGSGIDNAASSTGGAVAALHVTALSGFSSVAFKVQHSTDNSVWSDLITFTDATGVTSERKTVTGTINRYVRAWWDVTGTGSVTFALAVARR